MSGKKSVSSVVSPMGESAPASVSMWDSLLENIEVRVLRSEEDTTIGDISRLMGAGCWVTDGAFQRSERSAWMSQEHIDAVTDSLIGGVGFGGITVNLLPDGKYSVIDGAHRSRYIARILAGAVNYRGVNFADNPVLLAEFGKISVPLTVYQGLDDSECAHIFEALNGSIQLSAIEQRRGRVSFLVLSDSCKLAVKHLLAILPPVAGKAARRETAEEIILQAVSGYMGNRDYTGKAVVSFLETRKEEAVKALAVVSQNVADFMVDVQNDKEKTTKKALKKSWLNVLLALAVPVSGVNLAGFLAYTGADQTAFSEAASSSSASVDAVKTRFEIAAKIAQNTFTRESLKSAGKAGKAGKDSGVIAPAPASASAVDVKSARYEFIRNAFGEDTFTGEEMESIVSYVEKINPGVDVHEKYFSQTLKNGKGESSLIPSVEFDSIGGKGKRTIEPINRILMSAKK